MPRVTDSGCAIRCRNQLRVAVCDGRLLATSDIESCTWDLLKIAAGRNLPTEVSEAERRSGSVDAGCAEYNR